MSLLRFPARRKDEQSVPSKRRAIRMAKRSSWILDSPGQRDSLRRVKKSEYSAGLYTLYLQVLLPDGGCCESTAPTRVRYTVDCPPCIRE